TLVAVAAEPAFDSIPRLLEPPELQDRAERRGTAVAFVTLADDGDPFDADPAALRLDRVGFDGTGRASVADTTRERAKQHANAQHRPGRSHRRVTGARSRGRPPTPPSRWSRR